ncbi:hypothetical protein O181_100143 [Austropuccinia psidii MF-1]|uniref:Uncharacterized protein n=1 Tax=Austropuccinia psidii MF-1 TaxID=1389203 RepID=A0A9Q3JE39_9BASI|nr:hypothetical protein [Austropuccinia psidii MF-1]
MPWVHSVKPYFQTGEDKFPFRNKNYTPQEIVEVEDSPVPMNKIIKVRKTRLNGKYQRQYLVRFKNQTADKDKCCGIPYLSRPALSTLRVKNSQISRFKWLI